MKRRLPCTGPCVTEAPCKLCRRREYLRQWQATNVTSKYKSDPAVKAKVDARQAKHRASGGRAKYMRDYDRTKRQTDPAYRAAKAMRIRLRDSLRLNGLRKSERTMDLVGCDAAELRAYLETQFRPGMTWDNHGTYGWHIDHVRPLASFDLTDIKQRHAAFHYTNLQPLWAAENLAKGDHVAI